MRKTKHLVDIIGGIGFFCAVFWIVQGQGASYLLTEVLPRQIGSVIEKTSELVVGLDAFSGKAVLGIDDVEFQEKYAIGTNGTTEVSADVLELIQDFAYLKQTYYTIDSRTDLLETDIAADKALSMDFTIEPTLDEPKILIFHTHINEDFVDSNMELGYEEGIYGVGEELARILEEEYGIGVLHHDGVYDAVHGVRQVTGAYERMEPDIYEILAENPSIEVCIDMHRDGVAEETHLVTEIDGESVAKLMLFDGMCRLNGEAIEGLDNPFVEENLAFSLQMQLAADEKYPGLMRKIYLNPYRFSLHMMPRSILIEAGAQTNTKAEMKAAMAPLAEILAEVLLE
ncbi:stage II sporulation protein P [Chakrabartyella piscis]|uniref:stage II sporulation protein P n=1 Tax=Chakrabartyella piscis TaxID=2918914 RepID=UPI0029584087|nr:stage II sporulation protein P [Chakrabartyella piscis]